MGTPSCPSWNLYSLWLYAPPLQITVGMLRLWLQLSCLCYLYPTRVPSGSPCQRVPFDFSQALGSTGGWWAWAPAPLCPGITKSAAYEPQLQPTQQLATWTANARGFTWLSLCFSEQSSWRPASCPADRLTFPFISKGSLASLATTAFQKGSSFREKPQQHFLGMWEVKVSMAIQLKARKMHSGKETDGIMKALYSTYT